MKKTGGRKSCDTLPLNTVSYSSFIGSCKNAMSTSEMEMEKFKKFENKYSLSILVYFGSGKLGHATERNIGLKQGCLDSTPAADFFSQAILASHWSAGAILASHWSAGWEVGVAPPIGSWIAILGVWIGPLVNSDVSQELKLVLSYSFLVYIINWLTNDKLRSTLDMFSAFMYILLK